MNIDPQGIAKTYVPTMIQRFWRWAGFRLHLGDEPDGVEALSGWSKTEINFRFSLGDRLRLLLSGRLQVETVTYSEAMPGPSWGTRVDYRIAPPFGDEA